MDIITYEKRKKIFSNIAIGIASVGLATSIGSFASSIRSRKAKNDFVDYYKSTKLKQVEDASEVDSVLNMTDEDVFEAAKTSKDATIKAKLNDVEKKEKTTKKHIGAMSILLGALAANRVLGYVPKSEIERERY